MSPSLQVLPSATGQTENEGTPRSSADATESVTVTPLLAALELQTQTANVAVCPALTSDELEKDWTRTHSWATVFFFGFGEGEELGVGVGFAVFVGEGLGLGLEVDFFELLGVGVGVGDVLVDALPDVLGEGEALVDLLGSELELAEALGLELEDAARLCPATIWSVSDAMRTEFLGTDEQAALTIGCVTELVARASPDMLAAKKANPVRAPITTGFASCALTREPHFSASSGQNVFRPHIMHREREGN
jgi:hypothetical protein